MVMWDCPVRGNSQSSIELIANMVLECRALIRTQCARLARVCERPQEATYRRLRIFAFAWIQLAEAAEVIHDCTDARMPLNVRWNI